MKKAVIYIHGKGGNAAEAEHYRSLFPGAAVIGFPYSAETPWEARDEFPVFFDTIRQEHDSVSLIANSIGAFFAMSALAEQPIEIAYFISPIVDMEQLIRDMLSWAKLTEEELQERQTIETSFGETLSWDYLCYVRAHPLCWTVPTRILYGERDHLSSLAVISAFAEKTGASLTVMPQGEHWFHTREQMAFLDAWITHFEQQNRS